MELKILIKKWLPVLLWAGVIFYFSTDTFSSENTASISGALISRIFPAITPEQLEAINLMIRKFAHWAEYLILAILLLRAFESDQRGDWSWRYAGWTLAMILIYAGSDELHQAYVPSRSAAAGDVLVDLFGGSCGILWMYARRKRRDPGKQNHGDQGRDNT